jgi:hypothetical protein
MTNFSIRSDRRRRVFLSVFLAGSAALIVQAGILTVGASNRLQSNLAVMNRSPQSFIALGSQVEELRRITTNIDDYKLREIKSALTTTARLAGHAQSEFLAQYESWVSVQGEIEKDKDSFQQLRQRLDEVKRLQDSEIVRLKDLLDRSAKPSLIADGLNLGISFLVGILSSVLASHIYEKLKLRKETH